jgi:hypothetical protein
VLVVSGTVNLIGREDYLKLNPLAPAKEKAESTKVRLAALKTSDTDQFASGTKVEIRLADMDYKEPNLKEFSWKIPKDVTIMVDTARIANGKFLAEINMSKNPDMYAFKKDKYRLTLTIDPRSAPDFVQDRIGWHGEGLTDKNYLDTKTIPGTRIIRKEWIIDRKDII